MKLAVMLPFLRKPPRKQSSAATEDGSEDTGAEFLALANTPTPDAEPEPENEPPCGLEELVRQPADSAGCVDLIAIHGLNGHRHKTWTDPMKGLNWLSDEECLRKDIPKARVLTFGYNSRTYFSRSDLDVRDFASELLAAVKAARRSRTEQERPIVFLCHSLGGLVFKQAVVRAHEQNEYYSGILDNIRGVLFFATPHRGSDLAFWDRIGTSLVRVGTFGYLTNTKLSRGLEVDAEMLRRISDSFAYRGGKFKIRSFYETQRMPGLNCRVVEKESATLGWPNELDIAFEAHHSSICKFPSPSDQRYRTAIFAITELIGDTDDNENAPLSFREEACMRELNSHYQQHLGQVDDAVSGTCEWVLSHKKWSRWATLRESVLLWITADAGCGKSVIAKFLVNHFLAQRAACPRRHICYFFFKEGLEGQDNASAAISAVLHQLCCSQRQAIKHVMSKYTSMPKHIFNRFSSLWPIVMAAMEDPVMRDVVWILDGLDECERKSLDELLKALAAYFDSRPVAAGNSGTCLKIILLSRPHNSIHQKLRLGEKDDLGDVVGLSEPDSRNKMRLMAEEESVEIASDIERFARSKINEFGQHSELSPDVLCRLKERLISGADFTFLWISLVIKLVEDTAVDGISMAQLESILSTTNLDELYERLLSSRTHPLKTRKLLLLVLAAVRPLTLKEMCAAIEVYQDYYPKTSDAAKTRSRSAEYTVANLAGKRTVKPIVNTSSNQAALAQLMKGLSDDETARSRAAVNEMQPATTKGQLPGVNSSGSSRVNSPLAVSSLEDLGRFLHKPFPSHLRQICGHFLRIRGRKVYLVHQTAREFLLDRQAQMTPDLFSLAPPQPKPPLLSQQQERVGLDGHSGMPTEHTIMQQKWRHSIRLEDANRYLLHICADYIGLFEFNLQGTCGTNSKVVEYLNACCDDPSRAFFKYAALHWVDHYRPVRQSLDFSFDDLLKPSSKHFKIWIIAHHTWTPEEERSRLEAGGIQIGGDPGNPDEDLYFRVNLFSSALEPAQKQIQEFEAVLDHFNLSLSKETELFDKEFLAGDRYWKKGTERGMEVFDDDEGDGEGTEDREEHEADVSADDIAGKIPDRVQYYRRQNRRKTLKTLEELRNPMSGNPAWACRARDVVIDPLFASVRVDVHRGEP